MRTTVLTAALIAATAMPAMACNSDLLTVVEWQATKVESGRPLPYRIEATVRYNGELPYRMIHAGVMLADVLGGSVGQVNLKRDDHVSPGQIVVAAGQVSASERLGAINRDDINHRACVWSIVYEDGTVEKF